MVHDEVFWEVLELLSRFDLEMKKNSEIQTNLSQHIEILQSHVLKN